MYLSTQFLQSFKELEVKNYLDFKNNDTHANKSNSKITCLCIPPWAFENIDREHDWFHNAYSFQEMEPNVVKKYIDISSKFVLHGYWIMSSVEGHLKSAGGQKENISLSMIDDLMPKDFHKVKLPPSNL